MLCIRNRCRERYGKVANTVWKLANPSDEEFLFQNNATYVVLLLGGLTTNFIWCIILNARNRTFGDYTNFNTPLFKNYAFSALVQPGFCNFSFTVWEKAGLETGQAHGYCIWLKGVTRKTFATVLTGILFIILSIIVVDYGNSIK